MLFGKDKGQYDLYVTNTIHAKTEPRIDFSAAESRQIEQLRRTQIRLLDFTKLL